MTFFRAQDRLLRLDSVQEISVKNLDDYRVRVELVGGERFELSGTDAIELILLTKPSALEGRRLRWVRHTWALHNLVGHPGMQVLAWLGKAKAGIRLHERTTPHPKQSTHK